MGDRRRCHHHSQFPRYWLKMPVVLGLGVTGGNFGDSALNS
jgi:hypothetical protein